MTTKPVVLSLTATAVLLLAGCSGQESVTLTQAGSSTVLPIAEAWAEEFGSEIGASITVAGGGTGAGFEKFCRGELDIADASRAIKSSETEACEDEGIHPFELQVAIDGLSVIVDKSNTFVDCLSVEQLNLIWTADETKQANSWNDLDPAWPDQQIRLYGPGTDSGTFDYFVEVVIHPIDGKETDGRDDYTPSEDDNFIIQGVSSNNYGLGYLGLAYARENDDKVKVLDIDGGDGCVEPTDANVEDGTYSPLSRPLFMYTDGKPDGALADYFTLAFSDEGQDIVRDIGYIALPDDVRDDQLAKLD